MPFDPSLWTRYEFDALPIYIRGDQPSWFVPNKPGDRLLQRWQQENSTPDGTDAERFRLRLPDPQGSPYPGRGHRLETLHLRELWFHVTNRCNLTCSHCLFASCPEDGAELPCAEILSRAREAAELGCRVFALTGGEPFVHPDIDALVAGLLAIPDSHVVVLTNGLLLKRHLEGARIDRSRFHLQVSVDGLKPRHDRIRGAGSFDALTRELAWLKDQDIPFTLSMCVEQDNLTDMPGLIDFAADVGASNVHFMWYFIRGRGEAEQFAPAETIFEHLRQAVERAEARGIRIDNIDSMRTQVFAPAGTFHDGSNSGWESVAIGPDGKLYPSAALVGVEELAEELSDGLESAWLSSPALQELRAASAVDLDSPLRFLTGGGDSDHSFFHSGRFMGADPYLPLYEKIALWLIARETGAALDEETPRLRLKMGDILESCGAHGAVALTHANCLLSLANSDSRSVVKAFYADAVGDTNEDILNPVCYEETLIRHIPAEFRFRGYGCGSPVLDADIRPGETVVDLGCGGGVECFIAARMVGPKGKAIGVDMLDPMLALARKGAEGVRRNLGYDNLLFKKGYLEELPLAQDSVDAILSNCVMNLSTHKRRAFSGIYDALKPGGRLVISDVVCDREPDGAIRNDATLQGECIGGALTQKDLVGLLEESGFNNIRLIKRFPYRTVMGHPFYSLTFAAFKPKPAAAVRVMYRGPYAAVTTASGRVLFSGIETAIPESDAEQLGDAIFVFDAQGAVTNLDIGESCCCSLPPEARSEAPAATAPGKPITMKYDTGCMVCGATVEYFQQEKQVACAYCQKTFAANATCVHGHFVCDSCHSEDALQVIEQICLESREEDMLILLDQIRRHPAIPTHGPEHHALVPGIVLSTYRNRGGNIPAELIRTGIQRGAKVIGGSCAYIGTCGAATGVGIAFSLLLEADPTRGPQRQKVQQIAQQVLARIAALEAARCCQRDCWIALKAAAELSPAYLPLALKAEAPFGCSQQHKNKECIGALCPIMNQIPEAQVEPRADTQKPASGQR